MSKSLVVCSIGISGLLTWLKKPIKSHDPIRIYTKNIRLRVTIQSRGKKRCLLSNFQVFALAPVWDSVSSPPMCVQSHLTVRIQKLLNIIGVHTLIRWTTLILQNHGKLINCDLTIYHHYQKNNTYIKYLCIAQSTL